MANKNFEKIIQDFSTYFGLALNKVSFAYNGGLPVVYLKNKINDPVYGLRNIVSEVSKSENLELNTIQDQWVEYTLNHAMNSDQSDAHQVLKELNDYIGDKVYFVGNSLGPVDILMYYLLYNIMLNLTFQEKEKYIHTSRWFNNIQQDKKARIWRTVVPFSRSFLYVKKCIKL